MHSVAVAPTAFKVVLDLGKSIRESSETSQLKTMKNMYLWLCPTRPVRKMNMAHICNYGQLNSPNCQDNPGVSYVRRVGGCSELDHMSQGQRQLGLISGCVRAIVAMPLC